MAGGENMKSFYGEARQDATCHKIVHSYFRTIASQYYHDPIAFHRGLDSLRGPVTDIGNRRILWSKFSCDCDNIV